MRKKLKRLGTDIAGYSLIVLGVAFGWLPGPGGIPLILAGLGLLSINNPWAKKIIDGLKDGGTKFLGYAFPDDKRAQAIHDVLVVALFGLVIYVILNFSGIYALGFAIALSALGIVDLLYNRNRIKKFKHNKK